MPTEIPVQPSSASGPAKGRRLWFLYGTAALAAIAIAAIRLQPEMDQNRQDYATLGVVALALTLTLIWFALLSRFPWKTRLVTLAAIGALVFGLVKSLRVEGTSDAVGFPVLAWKWSPQRAPLPPAPGTAAATLSVPPGLRDVPQFFGPNRDGVVTGANLARDWNTAAPKQLWRQPIGAAWSAFAVVGGRAFTQEQRGEHEAVTCYEVLTGKPLWTHTNPVRFDQWQGGPGPRATPTVDRGLVFAYGATGILDCLEAATGKRLWSRDVLKENNLTNLEWGVSASPLVVDDTVIVTGANAPGPAVLAFQRTTGEPLWKSGSGRASYSSPALATVAGRRVVLVLSAATLTACDPASGEVLLNHAWASARTPRAAQPVVLGGNRIFLSAGYGVGCEMLKIEKTADGRLEVTSLWKNARMKNQFNTVAARAGHLYGLDDGVLACLDLETGERKWKDGRYGAGQTLLVDDLVLIQSESGRFAIAEAKPEGFRELGALEALSSKTWNHPTLAGRYLLLRNDREAVCYELPLAPAPAQ